jgi:hypothetical protein
MKSVVTRTIKAILSVHKSLKRTHLVLNEVFDDFLQALRISKMSSRVTLVFNPISFTNLSLFTYIKDPQPLFPFLTDSNVALLKNPHTSTNTNVKQEPQGKNHK